MPKSFAWMAFIGVLLGMNVLRGPPLPAQEKRADTPDEALLKKAGLGLREDQLLAYLQKRTGNDADLQRIDQVVRQLGRASVEDREQASQKLVLLGGQAIRKLVVVETSSDAENARRATLCRQKIGKDRNQILAIIRLLSQATSQDTTKGLLRFLPYALDEQMEEEIWFALDALACKQRLVDAIPAPALHDPLAVRRAAAGYLLARRGGAIDRKAARKLLEDTDATVRLRVAQGFLGARDRAGVPALIALLDQPSVTLGWQAEELLRWAASNNAPTEVLNTGTPEERVRCRVAWEKWWHQNAGNFDLTRADLDTRRPGLILAVPYSVHGVDRPILCGWDGVARWHWPRNSAVWDLHLLADDRWLVIEERAGPPSRQAAGKLPEKPRLGLLECSPEGKSLRQFNAETEPNVCLRLWNGNTFVVNSRLGNVFGADNVEEIKPDGKPVFRRDFVYPRGRNSDVSKPTAAVLLSNAHLIYGNEQDDAVMDLMAVDAVTGAVGKKIPCEKLVRRGSSIEPLANGHTLIATSYDDEVIEVDEKGTVVWTYCRPMGMDKNEHSMTGAVRLRDGNTLISRSWLWEHEVIEVDKAGKVTWRVRTPGSCRVRVCLALVRLGFDAPYPADLDLEHSVPWIIKGLSHRNPDIRDLCACQLEKLGSKAKKAVPALIDALDDPSIPNGASALSVLLGPDELSLLLNAAKDKRPRLRAGAIGLMRKYPREGNLIVPVLLEALRDPNAEVRISAVNSSMAFRDHGKALIPELRKLVKDEDVGKYAMWNLAGFGVEAVRPAIPAFIEIASRGDEGSSIAALQALQRICAEDRSVVAQFVQVLRDILKDKNQVNRWATAAVFVEHLGPKAKAIVPTLQQILDRQMAAFAELARDENPSSPYSVAERFLVGMLKALAAIGPDAKEALPSVRKALKVESRPVRQAATNAIKAMAGLTEPTLGKLERSALAPRTYLWVGVGGNLNWSNKANWINADDGTPATRLKNGDSVLFDTQYQNRAKAIPRNTGTATTSINDIPNLQLNQMTIGLLQGSEISVNILDKAKELTVTGTLEIGSGGIAGVGHFTVPAGTSSITWYGGTLGVAVMQIGAQVANQPKSIIQDNPTLTISNPTGYDKTSSKLTPRVLATTLTSWASITVTAPFELDAGLENYGKLIIETDGEVITANPLVNVEAWGTVNNYGTLSTPRGGEKTSFAANLTQMNALDLLSGTLHCLGSCTQSNNFSRTAFAGGNLKVSQSYQFQDGHIVGCGTITGNVTQTGGNLIPGNGVAQGAIGQLNIAGNYAQTGGTLTILINPADNSHLCVEGKVPYLTSLAVSAVDNFEPDAGRHDVFVFVLGGGNHFQITPKAQDFDSERKGCIQHLFFHQYE